MQQVTGKDIGEAITENVIVPLKLRNTSYNRSIVGQRLRIDRTYSVQSTW